MAAWSSETIRQHLLSQPGVSLSISSLENHTELPPLALQRFYQLIAADLEQSGLDFRDTMIDMEQKKGVFNLIRANEANYLVFLKLMRNKDRIGVGLAVFSRPLDRLLTIRYREAEISPPEILLISEADFGFQAGGFRKILEFPVRRGLLDIALLETSQEGPASYLFMFADEIVVYERSGAGLVPASTFSLAWPGPFFPSQEPMGRLTLFRHRDQLFLSAGSNFSEKSIVMVRDQGQWLDQSRIPFVPLAMEAINEQTYLIGAPFAPGKNYFQGRLFFMPLKDEAPGGEAYYKEIPAFFNAAFAGTGNESRTWQMIGTDYRWCYSNTDFTSFESGPQRYGHSLDVLDGNWLALSDFSRKRDRLFFYDIAAGGRRLVYNQEFPGEIMLIRALPWEGRPGFWLLLDGMPGDNMMWLQFWSNENQ